MRYWRIWVRLAAMGFANQTASPLSSFGYLVGKLVRLGFFLLFLSAIFKHTDALAGYSLAEAALFFLTFNIVDIAAQLFFRGIYGIRGLVREGDFDYFLIQPLNVLYRVAFNTVDFLDVVTIVPVLITTFWVTRYLPAHHEWSHWIWYAILMVNGMVIAFAIHVAVAALAVLTQEMDNTIWIYRDLMTLGRFPNDIYDASMRCVLTFIVPVAVMVSFPAKAFLGRLSPIWILHSFAVAAISMAASLKFWQFATRQYTSSSS